MHDARSASAGTPSTDHSTGHEAGGEGGDRLSQLRHQIEHAAHLLPTQGPITVFVHHNTLHAFEDESFHDAVRRGNTLFGCQPYLPESRYREQLTRGRIRPEDIAEALMTDLGERADGLLGFLGTRFHLRMAMLQHPLRTARGEELRWLIAETDALHRFRAEASPETRKRMVADTQRWLESDVGESQRLRELTADLDGQFGPAPREQWSSSTWESYTLHLLWRLCQQGVHGVKRFAPPPYPRIRHRDALHQAYGVDSDSLVHDLLIRFCSVFLDQGFARWMLPERDEGLFHSFRTLYRRGPLAAGWLRGLPGELRRLEREGRGPLESIDESLGQLGVGESERSEYLSQTLLALRGWAGMIWQMETAAEWTVHPAPAGSLTEYLAVRLILERLALAYVARRAGFRGRLSELRDALRHKAQTPQVHVEKRAFEVFQLAQVEGWSLADLYRLGKPEWSRLVEEIESFHSVARRKVYHMAYEQRFRNQTLDAFAAHSRDRCPVETPRFQVITCIDDREESFRRHLEELEPECETFGAPGFFAVAMYYQGAGDAHYRPLCPVIIKPQHFVREEVSYSLTASSRARQETRRLLGSASHRWHLGSRTFIGGLITALFGSLASVPLVARILFPRLTSQIRRTFGSLFEPPPSTELQLARIADPPGSAPDHLGYSVDEMTGSVERLLRDIGLTSGFSKVIVLCGHGSGSLNNPHESAYNCGACSGGRGGPNARAYAQMANDPRVRARLAGRGLVIPEETTFVGAFHNTCDESVTYFDLDRIPSVRRRDFEYARDVIDLARERNAQERCRRFGSAPLGITPRAALEHVETRAEDLSQARPEYNHATCAICFVGRRERTRGLYLDRRSFLQSYDPTQDDERATILARILAAAVPVCAGIGLEYYFSCVDTAGYGCGSKLPHNITSLLGVMEGAASDLRTGLSQQMVEIHEPMRLLFVIETTPEQMQRVIDGNPTIAQLVGNAWVQLATLDPESSTLFVHEHGRFVRYEPSSPDLPKAKSSLDWFRNSRDHLPPAEIVSPYAPRPPLEIGEGTAAHDPMDRGAGSATEAIR